MNKLKPNILGIPKRFWMVILMAAITAMLFTSYWESGRAAEDRQKAAHWVQHTLEVENLICDVRFYAERAESKSRGYILSPQQEDYHAAFRAAEEARTALDELDKQTADSLTQQKQVENLRKTVEAKMRFVREVIRRFDNNGLLAAKALVATGEGKRLMREIDERLAEVESTERHKLVRRKNAAERAAQNEEGRRLWALVLTAALVGLLMIWPRIDAKFGAHERCATCPGRFVQAAQHREGDTQ